MPFSPWTSPERVRFELGRVFVQAANYRRDACAGLERIFMAFANSLEEEIADFSQETLQKTAELAQTHDDLVRRAISPTSPCQAREHSMARHEEFDFCARGGHRRTFSPHTLCVSHTVRCGPRRYIGARLSGCPPHGAPTGMPCCRAHRDCRVPFASRNDYSSGRYRVACSDVNEST
ncbi:hypothetical protein OH77DRAFT_143760 [Trametes cingulata]|nr:hypothetical protein OH77DRAFT_143760 [Trametes cingulata]